MGMEDYPSSYIVDTSLLIDIYIGKIIVQFFTMSFRFIAPDVIIAELHEPDGSLLMELGLEQREFTGNQVLEVLELRKQFSRPSVNDLFALVGTVLRKRPRSRKVDKCGTVLSQDASDAPIIRARSSAETLV